MLGISPSDFSENNLAAWPTSTVEIDGKTGPDSESKYSECKEAVLGSSDLMRIIFSYLEFNAENMNTCFLISKTWHHHATLFTDRAFAECLKELNISEFCEIHFFQKATIHKIAELKSKNEFFIKNKISEAFNTLTDTGIRQLVDDDLSETVRLLLQGRLLSPAMHISMLKYSLEKEKDSIFCLLYRNAINSRKDIAAISIVNILIECERWEYVKELLSRINFSEDNRIDLISKILVIVSASSTKDCNLDRDCLVEALDTRTPFEKRCGMKVIPMKKFSLAGRILLAKVAIECKHWNFLELLLRKANKEAIEILRVCAPPSLARHRLLAATVAIECEDWDFLEFLLDGKISYLDDERYQRGLICATFAIRNEKSRTWLAGFLDKISLSEETLYFVLRNAVAQLNKEAIEILLAYRRPSQEMFFELLVDIARQGDKELMHIVLAHRSLSSEDRARVITSIGSRAKEVNPRILRLLGRMLANGSLSLEKYHAETMMQPEIMTQDETQDEMLRLRGIMLANGSLSLEEFKAEIMTQDETQDEMLSLLDNHTRCVVS